MMEPAGYQEISHTSLQCPLSTERQVPAAGSHTRTVVSYDAEATSETDWRPLLLLIMRECESTRSQCHVHPQRVVVQFPEKGCRRGNEDCQFMQTMHMRA